MARRKKSWARQYATEQRKLGMFKRAPVDGGCDGARGADLGAYAVGTYNSDKNMFSSKEFSFCLDTCEAESFNWWTYVLRVGNVIYFNNARYSQHTDVHQDMAWRILAAEQPEKHGLTVKVLHYKEGLNCMADAINNRQSKIENLHKLIVAPNSRKASNARRVNEIKDLKAEIKECIRLKKLFDVQMEANKETRRLLERDRTLEVQKKELVNHMRKTSLERLILRATSYVALMVRDGMYNFTDTKPAKHLTFHVLSFEEFQTRNLGETLRDADIIRLHPAPGKTREEAIKNLQTKIDVEFVTARVTGEAEPPKYVVA